MAEPTTTTTTATPPAAATPPPATPPAAAPPAKASEAAATGTTTLTAPPAEAAKPVSPAGEGAKPAPAVPEKYELKLPEGSPLEAQHVEKVAAYAKEQGLSNEQAQRLLERESQAVTAHVETVKANMKNQSEKWVNDVQADKEIGGEAFKQNVEAAHRVIRRFATDDFRKALEDTGLGNHPELVRTFVRIGKSMTDDQLVVPGAAGGTQKRSAEEVFYGGTK